KPLESELAEYADSATKGLIVVTFGSMSRQIPSDVMQKMLNVFGHFPTISSSYGTLKISTKASPGNVKLSKWVPQIDLFAHRNTKLFIGHGGNNGQMEAVYYGLPMATLPIFGDQFYNAQRITARNYDRVVNIREFTKDELYEAIADVLGNQTYADNIQKCSRIFHSMRDPHERLLFWVDHVLRFGGDHLRPTYMDLTLWKFFMLDVVGAILVFLLATVYCIWK
ncbi:hypothetical protein CAPTEDRAFT_48402, partial [Capitella teleta]